MLHVKAKAASGSPGVLAFLLPLTLGAAVTIVAASASLVSERPSSSSIAGLVALLAAATFTETVPLPIRGIPIGRTSLASVFLVGTAAIYGWAAATLMSFLMQLAVETGRRRPPVTVAYNSSVYALAAAAAGGAAAAAEGSALGNLPVATTAAAASFYAVDLALIALVVARTSREPFLSLLRRAVGTTIVPLTIMVSLSVVLVILWDRSPFLVGALFGPLLAFDLYQRSQLRTLEAMRAALTDPVTSLGNRRRFDERLQDELPPDQGEKTVSLCVLDVDNLKRINDRYGHPTGNRALAAVGARLAASGEAFRVGGDEFALLLPGLEPEQARLLVELALVDIALGPDVEESIRVSGGIASYPGDGDTPGRLLERADEALYHCKRHAPGSVCAPAADGTEPSKLSLATGTRDDRAARLQAAMSLARAVDARDALAGSHSESVARLAVSVGARLGCDPEQRELIELAGRLHDLGKVAIPDEILEKPGPLNLDERRILERHPAVGCNMLASLGLGPLAAWVLHHHERWDGNGYPNGVAGEAIPLPARILFAVDAFDAMTSEHAYREPLTREQAVGELERCAGTQFDEKVVAALVAELRDQDA
ncbi:MAG TPA: diguanylate cyclase [Gaiellaceae bacterium]|nr:diguanylate cyclase [Gaiellaceae bacterium]